MKKCFIALCLSLIFSVNAYSAAVPTRDGFATPPRQLRVLPNNAGEMVRDLYIPRMTELVTAAQVVGITVLQKTAIKAAFEDVKFEALRLNNNKSQQVIRDIARMEAFLR